MVTEMIPSSVARCCVGARQPLRLDIFGNAEHAGRLFFRQAERILGEDRPDRDDEDVQHGQEDGLLARQLEEEAPRHTDERRQHPESHARNEEGVLHLE